MTQTRTYTRSFAGGEVSPEMWGRIDDVKFQTGAAKLLNFVALPQGPAENRAGTVYVNEVKSSATKVKLLPFTYSTTQTMVLEFGVGYIRFHTNGATLSPGTPAAYAGATTYAIGDLVASGGVNYYCILATTGNAPPNATYWYAMPAGIYEIPNPYVEDALFSLHYVQSADVLTLVHPGYSPRELRRLGATQWVLSAISFASSVGSPTGVSVTASRGESFNISAFTAANPGVATTAVAHGLTVGDPVYVDGGTWTTGTFTDDFYTVDTVPSGTTVSFKSYLTATAVSTSGFGTYSANTGFVQYGDKALDSNNYYVVTSVANNGIDESPPSSSANVVNNLNAQGSFNSVSWTAASGAARYNIYKRQNGLYGFIGQTEASPFKDNNIAPDLGLTPTITDTVFASAGNYPGAVTYFEQRRVFAGTTNAPQTMWMTRTGTESDMSYHIPVVDTDRISLRVAAREANTIRHLVPLTQLLAMTSAAEWRVSPVNSDTITPTTISVRPQSYVGANEVQPSIVNNTVVYCSARDGHVRELGYSWQSNGFITGDLSLRATHLFDSYSVSDMCFSKSPYPLLWFISSTGSMLGLTYIPEQQIGAWHQHETDGDFESCTTVAEGTEDRLYVVVKRTIDGNTKRYVERFASRLIEDHDDCYFVDCGLTYNGTNTTATTVTVTGGTTWTSADVLTITASGAIFQYPATTDVGDVIVLTDGDGIKYRLTILSTTSTTVATARVDVTLVASLRSVATAVWAWARDTIGGLTHLEGKVVSILADGAVMPQETVSSGVVILQRPSTLVHVGLPYNSDLETLPMALQMEAFGQGRNKNVNEAWLRVFRSSGIFVGPDADSLVEVKQRTTEPYGSPPELKTDEVSVKLTPTWQRGGRIYVRQSDPLPLTIVGLTMQVSLGG